MKLASKLVRLALPAMILAGAWLGYSKLVVKAPQEKKPPKEARPILTQVMKLERVDFQTTVLWFSASRAGGETTYSLGWVS